MRTDVKMQRVILLAAEQRDCSPLKENFWGTAAPTNLVEWRVYAVKLLSDFFKIKSRL